MKRITFFVPIYEYHVWTQFGGTQDSFIAYAKKQLDCDIVNDRGVMQGAIITTEEYPDHCLWFKDSDPDASTIAHELFHSTCHAMRHKGIWPITKENEEAFAYLVGAFMQRVILQIKKINKKKKRKS